MDTAHRQLDRADRCTVALNIKHERSIGGTNIDCADIDALASTVRNCIMGCSQLASHLVVAAHHLWTRNLSQVAVEALDNCFERPVMIEMINFDVCNNGPVEREFEVGSVTLVCFDDQKLPACPLCSGTEVRSRHHQ